MEQIFTNYTKEDHAVWSVLFKRQQSNLQDKACKDYLDALENMSPVLHEKSIPQFLEINEWLEGSARWEIHCVPGLIPVGEFFQLLAQRKFCSSTWLRRLDQLDYLEEPDMFHDIFGHVPLLSNSTYSNFMHEFGKLGASVEHDLEMQIALQRLYWFTIEFGLIQEDDLKIYGAGILSSFGESNQCVKSMKKRHQFDLNQIILKEYDTDVIQDEYFVIKSFEELYNSIEMLIVKGKI